MIRPLAIFCTVLVLMLGSTEGWSADFQTGLNAYKIGNYATALREFRPLGEQGDAFSQFNLGVMYDNGLGVTENNKEAVKWYKLSAEQGKASAQRKMSKHEKKKDTAEFYG